MAKSFSIKSAVTRNELSTSYLQSESYVKITVSVLMLLPYITASRTSSYNPHMVSVVGIQLLVLFTVEEGLAKTCI